MDSELIEVVKLIAESEEKEIALIKETCGELNAYLDDLERENMVDVVAINLPILFAFGLYGFVGFVLYQHNLISLDSCYFYILFVIGCFLAFILMRVTKITAEKKKRKQIDSLYVMQKLISEKQIQLNRCNELLRNKD